VSTQIQVQAALEGLRDGTYEAIDALRVESNGGSQEIRASLTLKLRPELHFTPPTLDFSDTLERSILLENRGHGTLRVQITPREPWMAVGRRNWTIKPGKRARVRVSLIDAPPGAEGSIEIRALDKAIDLPVRRAPNSA
jgi:hypothetical protein